MLTDGRRELMDRFDQAVAEAFPDGVFDMKFCVNDSGTTADVMEQVIGALKQYTAGETLTYTDY